MAAPFDTLRAARRLKEAGASDPVAEAIAETIGEARAEIAGEVLSAAPVAAMIAEGRPVALHLAMTLHFAPPGEAARQVARYAASLPPGSVIAASVALVAVFAESRAKV